MAQYHPLAGNKSEPGLPVAGFEAVRGGARGQRVERKTVIKRREGAAAAIGPVAQPARQADADPGVLEVEAVSVDSSPAWDKLQPIATT